MSPSTAGWYIGTSTPGVDLFYHGDNSRLEYDFSIAPHSDPGRIRILFSGARGVRIDESGDLVLATPGGEIRQSKPLCYQGQNEAKRVLDGRYVMTGKAEVGFHVEKYDPDKELIIDPIFSYATYLGGSSTDQGNAIAVDSNGSAYVTGSTFSFNFPTTGNAFSTTYANGTDVFVTKFDAQGSSVIYSTFLGGANNDSGAGIAVDGFGNAFVTGVTSSADFPTTNGAFRTTITNTFSSHGFVAELNSAGSALVYSTFLEGSGSDQPTGIALDVPANPSGNAYITGATSSTDFPTTNGAFQTVNKGGGFTFGDAFVTKLNSTGSAPIYSTFIGGTSSDQATAIAVDSGGNVHITGSTTSNNFPTTPGAYKTTYGGASQFGSSLIFGDCFVSELNSTGSALIYSTYLGGSSDDGGLGIALDALGNTYVTGATFSADFPTTPGVVRASIQGVSKTTNAGASWAPATAGITLTQFQNQVITCIAVDPATPSTLYAGTSQSGIFKSINGGGGWNPINTNVNDLSIQAVAIDPTSPSTLYLGTNSHGVLKSTNGGATWKGIDNGENGSSVTSIAVDPVSPSTVYLGTNDGLFKTTDGGAEWASAVLTNGFSNSFGPIVVDAGNHSTVYAVIGGGIFKTTDGGVSWAQTGLGPLNTRALVRDPVVSSTIYAGGDLGVLKSIDGGATWMLMDTGLANRRVNALAINSSSIFAGTANGVFSSTDGGAHWTSASTGIMGWSLTALAADPLNQSNVYAGTASGSLNGFVAKLNPNGSALLYSTFLGGSSGDGSLGIAVDSNSNAYVTGFTSSLNFPTTPGAYQLGSQFQSTPFAFVAKLNSTATALDYSTYLGSQGPTRAQGIALDASLNAYVTGFTQSTQFPATPGSFQLALDSSNFGFGMDAFVAKIAEAPGFPSDLSVSEFVTPAGPLNGSVRYDITIANNSSEPAFSVFGSDVLPPGLIFTNCTACFGSGNLQTFTLDRLDPGASTTITINATVDCLAPNGSSVTNMVAVSSLTPDPVPANNTASVTNSVSTGAAPLISPLSQSFSANGSFGFVSVTTSGPCGWQAISNASWINIYTVQNTGNGNAEYNVAANNSTSPRSGTIRIAGQNFKVLQGAAFLDVQTNNPFYNEIGKLSARGVTLGCGNGDFCPDQPVTRGQMAAFIIRALGDFNPPTPTSQRFADVPPTNPFYAFIDELAARQITLGCGGGNYCPDAIVTRDQMAAFIIRGLGDFNPPTPTQQRFADVPPSNPFYAFIDQMAVLGITNGCGGGKYCPSDPVTRGQMAAFLVRAFNL